jgi:hypothetical protein
MKAKILQYQKQEFELEQERGEMQARNLTRLDGDYNKRK